MTALRRECWRNSNDTTIPRKRFGVAWIAPRDIPLQSLAELPEDPATVGFSPQTHNCEKSCLLKSSKCICHSADMKEYGKRSRIFTIVWSGQKVRKRRRACRSSMELMERVASILQTSSVQQWGWMKLPPRIPLPDGSLKTGRGPSKYHMSRPPNR